MPSERMVSSKSPSVMRCTERSPRMVELVSQIGLYQGTASAVPNGAGSVPGFSPCSQRLKPLPSVEPGGTTGSRALIQVCFERFDPNCICSPASFSRQKLYTGSSPQTTTRQRFRPAAGSQTFWKVFQLFLVDGLLQLDAGSKFGDATRSNLDDAASLRIAPVARLTLRSREGPEAHQGHTVALLQRGSDRIHYRIDRAPGSGFTDAVRGGDFIHQVPFVHACS